ncbi:MAG: LytTR family DNA-binding domain-containing protein [Reyranellaceae bacterium]
MAERNAGPATPPTVMTPRRLIADWRLPATWIAVMALSVVAHAYVEVADRGHRLGFGRAVMQELASHLVIAALLPALYWLHRRWPLTGGWRNLAVHAAGVLPFSLLHTVATIGLRHLWFGGLLGEDYVLPLTVARLAYEFSKDVVSYVMLTAAIVALDYVLARPAPSPEPAAPPSPAPAASATAPPERFAVRRRGGTEVMVDVAAIDWIEAAGNYAVLHVGGETFEIRSSLSRLEAELDARRFVRVHKSHIVNIARVAEVVPWVSGDWRLRLHDGAELSLSRRYRERFEALAPVKS